jgi:hypothetical protein
MSWGYLYSVDWRVVERRSSKETKSLQRAMREGSRSSSSSSSWVRPKLLSRIDWSRKYITWHRSSRRIVNSVVWARDS